MGGALCEEHVEQCFHARAIDDLVAVLGFDIASYLKAPQINPIPLAVKEILEAFHEFEDHLIGVTNDERAIFHQSDLIDLLANLRGK